MKETKNSSKLNRDLNFFREVFMSLSTFSSSADKLLSCSSNRHSFHFLSCIVLCHEMIIFLLHILSFWCINSAFWACESESSWLKDLVSSRVRKSVNLDISMPVKLYLNLFQSLWQVSTRFLSASPPLYWFGSYVMASPSFSKRWGYIIWTYCAAYILLGSLLFSNFYPFTWDAW